MIVTATETKAAFPPAAIEAFSAAYPDRHEKLQHDLCGHPLLTREAIAALAERHPQDRMEYNLGTLPLGIRPEDTPANGLSVADTIRTIEENRSWVVLKNVERDPAYGALLDALLAELEPVVRPRTGPMEHREAFIFFTSPGSVTPFHMDPEHNILMQIEGEKVMHVFPVADPSLVPPEQSEAFHAGAHRNLHWEDDFLAKDDPVHLTPGTAVLMPVKAPHFVQNGDAVSISFSITWRSERSVAEGELHSFNRLLRTKKLPLVKIGRTPEAQKLARVGYRVMRKLS
ncbi:cupin-like domain-containing protein [Sphingobium nicotianae]|uniref:Transcriptional regulator n=1 Tax=Sphingobium nicotianae TaxID=2782607 RepID=A0A9X1ISZ8_9SPHN|nr:cupin-like domain-containing protein [Sphingobium nicotianae]MBT2188832.1 transcriptional regulator [Sphingobium nicotianae]